MWNAAGEEPADCADLGTEDDPRWVGNWALPAERQGLTVLGTPLGHHAFVREQLRQKRAEHDRLLGRIPRVPDLQASWLLLLFCANARSNYLLRVLPPSETAEFATEHDAAMRACLAQLLADEAPADVSGLHWRRAQVQLSLGGLGLRSASRLRFAAYWASWADTLPETRILKKIISHIDFAQKSIRVFQERKKSIC